MPKSHGMNDITLYRTILADLWRDPEHLPPLLDSGNHCYSDAHVLSCYISDILFLLNFWTPVSYCYAYCCFITPLFSPSLLSYLIFSLHLTSTHPIVKLVFLLFFFFSLILSFFPSFFLSFFLFFSHSFFLSFFL